MTAMTTVEKLRKQKSLIGFHGNPIVTSSSKKSCSSETTWKRLENWKNPKAVLVLCELSQFNRLAKFPSLVERLHYHFRNLTHKTICFSIFGRGVRRRNQIQKKSRRFASKRYFWGFREVGESPNKRESLVIKFDRVISCDTSDNVPIFFDFTWNAKPFAWFSSVGRVERSNLIINFCALSPHAPVPMRKITWERRPFLAERRIFRSLIFG